MSRDPRDDTQTYSLGVIVSRMMKVATPEQVGAALEEQRRMNEEEVLGSILVARGIIDKEQLTVALEAQRGLRSKKKSERAMAMAKLSQVSGAKIIEIAEVLRKHAGEARRSATGQEHPAITDEMLANGNGK